MSQFLNNTGRPILYGCCWAACEGLYYKHKVPDIINVGSLSDLTMSVIAECPSVTECFVPYLGTLSGWRGSSGDQALLVFDGFQSD